MARLLLGIYRVLIAMLVPVAIPMVMVRDRMIGKRRPPWPERFVRKAPLVSPGGLWIHAVSVGEVEVARRIVRELPRYGSTLPVTLTATTATGLALARNSFGDEVTVAACPIDLIGPIKRFFAAVQPRALILIETELWPEMLYQAGARGIPVVVVNARLAHASFRRYRRVRAVMQPLLEPLTMVLARDACDARRFEALGIAGDRIHVAGNIKYDLEKDERPLEWGDHLASLSGDRPVFVAGSTMEGEEELVLDSIEMLAVSGPPPFLVLAPRHPERCESVARLLSQRRFKTLRRSQWSVADRGPYDVLLIDTIGELARAYRYARVAFVGGSLVPTGGHNPLEPAVWGVPVLTGPNVTNFDEVYRVLIAAGGARVVADPAEITAAVAELVNDHDLQCRVGSAGRSVVEGNRGATARICAALSGLL